MQIYMFKLLNILFWGLLLVYAAFSRVVTGLLTRHSILWWHPYIMRLTFCRWCGEEVKPLLTFCVRVKLRSHSDIISWASLLCTPWMLEIWAWEHWNFTNGQGSPGSEYGLRGTKGLFRWPKCIRDEGNSNPLIN